MNHRGFNFTGLSFETLAELLEATANLLGLIDEGRYNPRFPDTFHKAMTDLSFALEQSLLQHQAREDDGGDEFVWIEQPLPPPVDVDPDTYSAFTRFFEDAPYLDADSASEEGDDEQQ